MRRLHVLRRLIPGMALVGGLLCLATPVALAAPTLPLHAKVVSADPAIGSTLSVAPTAVTVTAAEEINPDPAGSDLLVYGPGADATDTLISQGHATVPLSDPKHMTVKITPTPGHVDGVYVVVWKTVSADDGDPASGSFTFTVNARGTSGTPTTQPHTPGATVSGIPLWVPIVASLAALLVGLGAGLGLGRRKQAALSSSSLGALRRQVELEREQE